MSRRNMYRAKYTWQLMESSPYGRGFVLGGGGRGRFLTARVGMNIEGHAAGISMYQER